MIRSIGHSGYPPNSATNQNSGNQYQQYNSVLGNVQSQSNSLGQSQSHDQGNTASMSRLRPDYASTKADLHRMNGQQPYLPLLQQNQGQGQAQGQGQVQGQGQPQVQGQGIGQPPGAGQQGQPGQTVTDNQSSGPGAGQEMNLASVLHYLQSEWRRWERDRNEWEIERAEMRVCARAGARGREADLGRLVLRS
jgi:hypothetical protein